MWNFPIIIQERGEIWPDFWITSDCLFNIAFLKRFLQARNFFIFSKIHDGLFKDFSKFLKNWTLKELANFWTCVRGRRQASHFRWDIVLWTDDNEDIRLQSLPVILIVGFFINQPRNNRNLTCFVKMVRLYIWQNYLKAIFTDSDFHHFSENNDGLSKDFLEMSWKLDLNKTWQIFMLLARDTSGIAFSLRYRLLNWR